MMPGKSGRAGARDQSSGVRGESTGWCPDTTRDVNPAPAAQCQQGEWGPWVQARPGHPHDSRTDQWTEDHQAGTGRRHKTWTPGRLEPHCHSSVCITL